MPKSVFASDIIYIVIALISCSILTFQNSQKQSLVVEAWSHLDTQSKDGCGLTVTEIKDCVLEEAIMNTLTKHSMKSHCV